MSARLSSEEWGYLIELLQRFAESDLDQHEAWQLDTAHGAVYLRLTRERGPDEPAEAFRPIRPSSPYRTGRVARVSGDLADVSSRDDVLRVVSEMTADLDSGGAAEWENGTLGRFLDAYGGVLDGLDGYFTNRGEPMTDQPDWELLARLLVTATGFE